MFIKTRLLEIDLTTSGLYARLSGVGSLDVTFWGTSSRWFSFQEDGAFNFHLGRLSGCMDRG